MSRHDDSPYRDIPTAFDDVRIGELGEACLNAARDILRKDVQRTADERQALADCAAELLWRAGKLITPNPYVAHTPETFLRRNGGKVADYFNDWAQKEYRAVRSVALARAADWALANDAFAWEREVEYGRGTRMHIAQETDEELMRQLRALDERLEEQRKKHRDYGKQDPAAF